MDHRRLPHRVVAATLGTVVALVATSASAAGVGSLTAPGSRPSDSRLHRTVDQVAQLWAESTVKRMSLEQKVGQLFITYAYGPTANTAHPKNREEFGVDTPAEVVQRYYLGGIIHFGYTDSLYNPKQIAELSNGLQQAATTSGAGVPLLIGTDQEQGTVTRIGPPVTQFPGNMALGAGRRPEDAAHAAAIAGQELRAVGLNENFAPVGDVNVNPANPVIGVRSFSSDPDLAARLTGGQVNGYQDSTSEQETARPDGAPQVTVSAVVKHFPGHGDTNQDSHVALPVVEHDRQQWERLDAPPFREAIAHGVDSVMTAHIVVPKLDNSGEPSTLSPRVLTGMLRGELGFRGVIITDSLQMEGVRQKHPDAEIPVLALKAGADQLLMPKNLPVAISSVIGAVRSGDLPESRIDESVQRILELKFRRGIVSNPLVDVARVADVVGSREHLEAAQQITDRSVTVLRNDQHLLPFRQKPGRALVTGVDQQTTGDLADRLRARGSQAAALPTGSAPTQAQIAQAVDAAKQHDVTVVLTNGAWKDANASQRDLLRALAGAGARVVAVPVRDPYDAGYVDEIPTWVATYSSKPVSMESVARLMFGEIKPSGTLPVPVPEPTRPGTDRYPFGYGLTW